MYIYILKPTCTPRSPEQFESRHLDMYIYIYFNQIVRLDQLNSSNLDNLICIYIYLNPIVRLDHLNSSNLDTLICIYIYILTPNCTPRSTEQFGSRHLDMYIYLNPIVRLDQMNSWDVDNQYRLNNHTVPCFRKMWLMDTSSSTSEDEQTD